MRRILAIAMAVSLCVLSLLPATRTVTGQEESAATVTSKFFRSENPLPGQYLVLLNNIDEIQLETTAGTLTGEYNGQLLACPYEPGINGFSVQLSEANAIALSEDARVQSVQEIPAEGFAKSDSYESRTNVALAANGAQAFASSSFSTGYPASGAINGDRKGLNWGAGGGWNDATIDQYTDELWIEFNGPKQINEINVVTVQDNYANPQEPRRDTTFSLYGLVDFDVYCKDSITGQTVTLEAVRGNNRVWRQIKFEPVNTTKIFVRVLNARGYSRITEVEAWEAPPPPPKSTNVALAANGGQAFASSTLSAGYPVSSIINGDRRGTGWANGTGGWHDATGNSFPDYLEVHFAGEKRINEIDFITLQDAYTIPSEPNSEMTFSQFGVTAFRINYWDSALAQWVMLIEVQGNNKVWRNIQFPVIATSKLSIMILNGANNYSRVVEIEAWEAPAATNVALAENGGQAYASSTLSQWYPPSALINGERKGTGWANGSGGWHDATGNSFPDYLEVHFNEEKRIHEIDLFTLQDNYPQSVTPTPDLTFSLYGVTAYRVSYWDSTSNQWVMLAEILGNNKVWCKLEFDPIRTSKLSIMILNGLNSYSRLVEIEAWQAAGADVSTPDLAALPPAESEQAYEAAFAALPATAPTPPPHRLMKSSNQRYFYYNNKTVPLFGISGSYLPHIARARPRTPNNNPNDPIVDPVKENCTFDVVSGQQKFKKCIALIKGAGLNHIQIWVVLNHSVGKLPMERGTDPNTGRDPYPNEQPFIWNSSTKKWDLNKTKITDADPNNDRQGFDDVFFTNLWTVVKFCQDNDVLVGVVLFDPWQGTENGIPNISPWYGPNNKDNLAFSDPAYFVKAENPNASPDGSTIDSTEPNITLRKIQVALMKRTAYELQDLKNFYWLLANEPDMDPRGVGPGVVLWHKYMSNQLRKYETTDLGGKVHLIAATLTTNQAGSSGMISALRAHSKIDIIASHYVHLDSKTGLPSSIRYGALRLLKTFNDYQPSGLQVPANNEIWGFNEDRYTGTGEDNDTDTAAAARVEAWEFFMNGGGLYDHLSYRWGNSSNEDAPMSTGARTYFKYLSNFVAGIPLDNMHRFTSNQTSGWLLTHPADNPTPDNTQLNSPYWAAMSNGTHFFYYVHRSKRFGLKADRYRVYTGGPAAPDPVQVQKSGLGTGCFVAEWYYPDGKLMNGQPAVTSSGQLTVVQRAPFFFTSTSTPRSLTGPLYKQDLVMRITKRPGVTQANCN